MPKPRSRKRKGPKSTRAGCLLCKPHKHQRARHTGAVGTRAERRARADHEARLREDEESRRGP